MYLRVAPILSRSIPGSKASHTCPVSSKDGVDISYSCIVSVDGQYLTKNTLYSCSRTLLYLGSLSVVFRDWLWDQYDA